MSNLFELKKKMLFEADVEEVIKLLPVGNEIRYLIKTPFTTFPKFVIGMTDSNFEKTRIIFRCGLLGNALREWDKLEAPSFGFMEENK